MPTDGTNPARAMLIPEEEAALSVQDRLEELSGFARTMLDSLRAQIGDFESRLQANQETGAILANHGGTLIIVTDIAFRRPHLLIIFGELKDRQRVELLQHVSQVNLLLRAMPAADPGKPRRIGFTMCKD